MTASSELSTPPVGPDDLILAHGSLGSLPFDQRVAAAAAAGFAGLGLSVWEYERLRDEGWSDADMRRSLEQHGMRLAELEVVLGFEVGEARDTPIAGLRYADADSEARFFAMADAFGPRHMQAVGAFDAPLADHAVEAFAGLCDRAAEHGLLVALEFVPTTSVPDCGVATRIVSEAARPNGGLCVDSWHHFRGARDEALLRATPPERVFMIQLDDGPTVPRDPDFLVDTTRHRELPGQGDFDLVGFLRLLWDIGVQAPVSVEILSEKLADVPPTEAAARIGDATRAVLAAARSAPAS